MNFFNRLFRKETDKEEILPILDLRMKYIYEAIKNHLSMKTTGALLLTGDWGSGKTYHIKKEIFPLLENETDFVPLIVSLYGVSNKDDIAQKVLFSYFDKKGKDSNVSTSTIRPCRPPCGRPSLMCRSGERCGRRLACHS